MKIVLLLLAPFLNHMLQKQEHRSLGQQQESSLHSQNTDKPTRPSHQLNHLGMQLPENWN